MKTNSCRKVLVINTIGMGYEGMSSVIMNYLRTMPLDGLELHITAYPGVNENIQKTLETFGSVHIVPAKKRDLKGYLHGIWKILKTGIDVIHIHGNSGTMAMEVVLAKLCRVPKVIVHSHSTKTDHPLANAVLRYPMALLADQLVACSEGSGRWLYKNWKFTVLNNAIDSARFSFDPVCREVCRKELGLDQEFLVGHVGHFTEPKNHFYLVNVFHELHKRKPDARLLLVGGGPDFDAVVEKVNNLHLQDAVIFAGRRPDVERLYQAMDVFLMPSRWEGLPLVLLEAQASGLPVVASDRITRDVCCTENFWYLNIEDSPAVWAEKLLQLSETPVERSADQGKLLREHGFDIYQEAGRLREMYLR